MSINQTSANQHFWSGKDGAVINWGYPDNTTKLDINGNVIFTPWQTPAPTTLTANAPRAGEHPNWFWLRYGNNGQPVGHTEGGSFVRAQLNKGREAELIATVVPSLMERIARKGPNLWGLIPGQIDITSIHDFLATVDIDAALQQYPPSLEGWSTDKSNPKHYSLPNPPYGLHSVNFAGKVLWMYNDYNPSALSSTQPLPSPVDRSKPVESNVDVGAMTNAIVLSNIKKEAEKVRDILPTRGGGAPIQAARKLVKLILG